MKIAEIIRNATTRSLSDEDGNPVVIELRPGLSTAGIDMLERDLPCSLPDEIRDLLSFCSGFAGGAIDLVDFTGQECNCEYSDIFPHGHPIAADGFGNFWIVDLLPTSNHWEPIYFACHDAPVILYQSPSLEHFLIELFKYSEPPHESLIDDVHEDRIFDVWRKNPGVIQQLECLTSNDADLRQFAQELDSTFQIIDMRDQKIGMGFSWGRYGPRTAVRRFGNMPIFAYQKPPSLLRRIFK
jgi:cell wall assembly regulator SMI1